VFVDEVKAEEKRPGGSCAVTLLFESIDEDARDEIEAVFTDPVWDSSAITRALNKRGHGINADSIRRHRRRVDGTGCQCPS